MRYIILITLAFSTIFADNSILKIKNNYQPLPKIDMNQMAKPTYNILIDNHSKNDLHHKDNPIHNILHDTHIKDDLHHIDTPVHNILHDTQLEDNSNLFDNIDLIPTNFTFVPKTNTPTTDAQLKINKQKLDEAIQHYEDDLNGINNHDYEKPNVTLDKNQPSANTILEINKIIEEKRKKDNIHTFGTDYDSYNHQEHYLPTKKTRTKREAKKEKKPNISHNKQMLGKNTFLNQFTTSNKKKTLNNKGAFWLGFAQGGKLDAKSLSVGGRINSWGIDFYKPLYVTHGYDKDFYDHSPPHNNYTIVEKEVIDDAIGVDLIYFRGFTTTDAIYIKGGFYIEDTCDIVRSKGTGVFYCNDKEKSYSPSVGIGYVYNNKNLTAGIGYHLYRGMELSIGVAF